jgi:hypothetical protein
MELDKIRILRQAKPFRQFYIICKNGRRAFVDQPYQVGIASDGSHLIVCPNGDKTLHLRPDDIKDFDVIHSQC